LRRKYIMELMNISIKKVDEWYDVGVGRKTSATSSFSGTKRCSLDEIEDHIKDMVGYFIEDEKRIASWKIK
jgi:hypothetical protein